MAPRGWPSCGHAWHARWAPRRWRRCPTPRSVALRAALADPGRPRLLLALDNVEPGLDAGAVLDTLAGGRATLLLTSRGAVAPGRLQAFPLEPLADPAAVQLFTQRLHQADPTRPTPDDTLAIPALAGLLGGLPLAIELAAAYAGIQRRPWTRSLPRCGRMDWLVDHCVACDRASSAPGGR